MCLSTILRRQWVEQEKFSFPLVQLPTAMSTESNTLFNTFFRRQSMWLAFMVPVIIHTISTLHFYYPIFPQIPLRFRTWDILSEKPWNVIQPFDFDIQLSTIGLSYLMSLEISLSLWGFYLIYKLERLIGNATGISSYFYNQGFVQYREKGAYLILFIFFCFIGRNHLHRFLSYAIRSHPQANKDNEPIEHRWALVGLFVSLVSLSILLILAGANSFALMFSILFFFAIDMCD